MLAVCAAVFGIMMALSPLIQLAKVVKLGAARDVSVLYLLVILFGANTWFLYGLALGNWALIVANGLAVISNAATILTVLWLQRRQISAS